MKKILPEIFWLRSIACIGIVIIHSVSLTLSNNPQLVKNEWPTYLQIYLMFCTPAFVFISEFLIAHMYGDKLKRGFFKKRLLYLGLPYVFLNIYWTFSSHSPQTLMEFIDAFLLVSIRGYSVTYFIVIIFQFYILHYLFSKYLRKLPPIPIIIISIILTSIYWGIRLIYPSPENFVGGILWGKEGQTIFFGWLTYFVLGYYIGIYYEKFTSTIKNYTFPIITLFLMSILIVFYTHTTGLNSAIGSKRLDTPIYTTAVLLLFFLIQSYIVNIPRFIVFISNYSFSIYLLHLAFMNRMGMLHEIVFYDILYKSILGITLSICFAYIINRFSLGKFIVGNVPNFRVPSISSIESVKKESVSPSTLKSN
ncbi:acyltransferase family protein [Salinicoccus jeotgali]